MSRCETARRGHVTRFPVASSIMTVQVDPAFDLDGWMGLVEEHAPT